MVPLAFICPASVPPVKVALPRVAVPKVALFQVADQAEVPFPFPIKALSATGEPAERPTLVSRFIVADPITL